MMTTRAGSVGTWSGAHLMGRDIYVSSIVDGVSFCFNKVAAAPAAGVVVCLEIFNANAKLWR